MKKMTLNDPLANLMSNLYNAEKRYKKSVEVKPASKVSKSVLQLLQDHHYVGSFEEVETNRGKYIVVNLINRINKCGVVKPRFAVTKYGYEKFEKQFLLAKDFGIIIVSTNKGVMTHIEAKQKGLGGRLLAYCY